VAKIRAVPVDRTEVPPRELSPRLRSQLVYFMGSPPKPDGPTLGESEYWFDPKEVETWLDEGVFYLVSPLDTANQTEVEISEEQEDFLGWLKRSGVAHVRIAE